MQLCSHLVVIMKAKHAACNSFVWCNFVMVQLIKQASVVVATRWTASACYYYVYICLLSLSVLVLCVTWAPVSCQCKLLLYFISCTSKRRGHRAGVPRPPTRLSLELSLNGEEKSSKEKDRMHKMLQMSEYFQLNSTERRPVGHTHMSTTS